MFFGWHFVVPANGSVVSTMEQALNSSIANPSPDNGYVYSPVISEYTPVCTDFGFRLLKEIIRNGSCGVEIYFPSRPHRPSIKTERSPNRWSITVASGSNDTIIEGPAMGFLDFVDPALKTCAFMEDLDSRGYVSTTIAKCARDNGEIAVVAMTATRFSAEEYQVVDQIEETFSTYHSDDLLSTMSENIRTKALPAPPGQEPHDLVAEIRVVNSTAEAFICEVYDVMEGFLCVYYTIAMHIFKQSVPDDQIRATIERLKSSPLSSFYHHMGLEYFPELTKDNTLAPISTKKMRDDTVAAATYMAQIGSSFFADFGEDNVYVLYDKSEIEAGLEIPLWVLIAAGIITLVSLCVWQLTDWLVGPPHTSSLYSIVRTRLEERSGNPVPMLMRFKLPLIFEDVNLLPDQVEHLSDETRTFAKSEWARDI
ncbi:hypothetical protein BGX34_001852 [Mortierella sp. NVP85]|nr:hypothetical protein BGX34_001852 [Mortierella sp. NVP85]